MSETNYLHSEDLFLLSHSSVFWLEEHCDSCVTAKAVHSHLTDQISKPNKRTQSLH